MQRMMTRRSLIQVSLGAAGASASAGFLSSLLAPSAFTQDSVRQTDSEDDKQNADGGSHNTDERARWPMSDI